MTVTASVLGDERSEPAAGPLRASPAVRILQITAVGCLPVVILAILASPADRPAWDNLHWSISAVGAALATAWSVRGTTGRVRDVRTAGAAFLGLWMLATLNWALLVLTGSASAPSISDLLILSMVVPSIAVLLGIVHGQLSAAEEAAVFLDGALVVLLVATLIVLVFGPNLIAVPTYASFAAAVYPTAFLGLSAAGIVAAMAVGNPFALRGGPAFVIGGALFGLAYLSAIGPVISFTDPGEVSSVLFTAGTLVAAFGVVTWQTERSTNGRYLTVLRTASRITGPLVASLLFLLLLAPMADSIDLIVHLLVFAGAIVLIFRQGLIVRERTFMLETVTTLTYANRRLVGELRRELEERRRAEPQTIKAARADAVEALSASVGHEVNNPLTGVLGYAELVLAELPADHPSRPDVETIRLEALRARRILSSLRDLASPRPPRLQSTDLAALVQRTAAAARMSGVCSGTEIDDSCEPMEPLFLDGGAIARAISIVLANACQATAAGGRIRVTGGRADSDVVITVADDGTGMDEAAQRLAFEPFHSGWPESGPAGPATGLGLSIANGLVAGLGGKITISSSPGLGTTVEIRVPLATSHPAIDVASEDIAR
ncbi:MAG: HAMP domain-containing histidine kinase [Chloroflexi bacterium]|nr:HAMP domain-containing histidine kinase [Chloroflexota bacterium]